MKEWLQEFKKLHERHRQNELTGADRAVYLQARETLASALIKAQGMQRQPEETARAAFRVAQALQVEFRFAEEPIKTLTLDIARGGFSALLAHKLEPDEVVSFALKMPGGADPLTGKAKVVSAKRQGATTRFSFNFVNLSDEDTERLEMVIFDSALSRFTI